MSKLLILHEISIYIVRDCCQSGQIELIVEILFLFKVSLLLLLKLFARLLQKRHEFHHFNNKNNNNNVLSESHAVPCVIKY